MPVCTKVNLTAVHAASHVPPTHVEKGAVYTLQHILACQHTRLANIDGRDHVVFFRIWIG